MYSTFFKRAIDLILSSILLLTLFPIMIIIFLLLTIVNKGSPMFTQQRVGKKNAIFTLLKFKTLTNACDENGVLKEDYLRVTAVGQILRKTSLDELPQLINVIKGDMSLIGPRPLLIKYLPFYNAEESKRHNVKPGLSGLAQISGRNELDWNSRLRLDVQYVENISFKLDFFIFFKTIGRILSAKDVITNKPYTISDLDHERKIS